MTYPAAVVTRPVQVGAAFSVEGGRPLTVHTVTVASRALIHRTTGARLEKVAYESESMTGEAVWWDIATTDQSNAFLDAETRQAIILGPDEHTHLYTTTLTILDGETQVAEYVIGPYPVPSGSSLLDLDSALIPEGSAEGTLIAIPESWEQIITDATAIAMLRGKANGVASLDGNAVVPESQLPARLSAESINAAVASAIDQTALDGLVDAIAEQPPVVDAAAAAVDANPKIATIDTDRLGRHLAVGEHLDTVKTPGHFYVDTDAEAPLSLGFPVAKAGMGEVRRWNDSGTILVQTWHPFRYEGFFLRFFYSGVPYTAGGPGSGWMEFQTKTAVTALIDERAGAPRSSMTTIGCLGDSLTAGYSNGAAWNAADAYPAKLAVALGGGVTVQNRGSSGATTDQINARAGVLPLEMKIPSGSIPASGPVTVTTDTVIGEWGGANSFNVYGWLAGVYGILSYTQAGGYTFTRGTSGTAVTATRATFEGEYKPHSADTVIYGGGRNDITKRTKGMEPTVLAHMKRGYTDVVNYLTPKRKQFVFLGTITRTDEAPGSTGFEEVKALREWLADTYPSNFLDLQGYLTGSQVWTDAGITPTQADLDAQAVGKTPPTLFDDVTHYNRATAAAIGAKLIAPFLKGKGWV